jgi:chromosome segregation ATPase
MSDMQKDLADKDREIGRLLDELKNKKPEVQVKEVLVTPPGYTSLSDALEEKTAEFKKTTQALDALKREVTEVEKNRDKAKAALAAAEKVHKTMEGVSAAFESFAGKLTAAQLAVQASDSPAEHRPMFETLSAMMRKSQSELDAWLAK